MYHQFVLRDAQGVGVLEYLGSILFPSKVYLRLQDVKYISGDFNQYFTAYVNRIIVQCKSNSTCIPVLFVIQRKFLMKTLLLIIITIYRCLYLPQIRTLHVHITPKKIAAGYDRSARAFTPFSDEEFISLDLRYPCELARLHKNLFGILLNFFYNSSSTYT